MAKTTPRLYVEQALCVAAEFTLEKEQSHYLTNVLRMVAGDALRVFNSTDGEWLAYITETTKKTARLRCEKLVNAVQQPPDIDYLFAPLKHQRLDYLCRRQQNLGHEDCAR